MRGIWIILSCVRSEPQNVSKFRLNQVPYIPLQESISKSGFGDSNRKSLSWRAVIPPCHHNPRFIGPPLNLCSVTGDHRFTCSTDKTRTGLVETAFGKSEIWLSAGRPRGRGFLWQRYQSTSLSPAVVPDQGKTGG